jgi:hypothetical protein
MPVKLTVYIRKSDDCGEQPPAVSSDVRTAWVKRMAEQLQRPGAIGHFAADLDTGAGTLQMDAHRVGTAAAVAWKSDDKTVAVSVLLQGRSGDDDAAAMKAFRDIPCLAEFEAKEFNHILALERPSLSIIHADPRWHSNGMVELAAAALALALMAAPGTTPTMEPADRPLTAEEEAQQRKEIDDIGEVFRIIQNDWATRRQLLYTVRSSEKIAGRPIHEIMGVTFWVGAQGKGRTLNIHGLVSVFKMLKDYVEQAPTLNNLKQPTTRHTISLTHEPAFIQAVLTKIKITEPE